MALEPEWEHCGGDWAAFDLVHPATGLRMQVKQSAARQSWHGDASPPPRPRYSIASKTGRWEGSAWIAEPGRNADLFVFAWHPITDATADHRDPTQWRFHVVPQDALPTQGSISLNAVGRLALAVSFAELARTVDASTPGSPRIILHP